MDPQILQALLSALELKDVATAAHTWRVTLYTRALAERFDTDADTLRRLTYAAALHDIGKIDIPESILRKPGPLTHAEFEIVKSHPARGHERLLVMGEDDEIMLDLVRHHHERWDGLGYPDGLAGEAIPMGARFFTVIDTFDALTSFRSYRQEVGADAAERALAALQEESGRRYWPPAVEEFVALYRTGQIDWIRHHFNDEAPFAFDFAGVERARPDGAGP